MRLSDVPRDGEERVPTGVGELDRVLGGGLVPGSLVLIGGEPGIGKSTLVMQALAHLSAERRVLLVTGEESPRQVRSRAARLAGDCGAVEVAAETRLQSVVALIESGDYAVCAVDSVQTLSSDTLDGAPGTVGQIREAAADLLRAAKSSGVTVLLVGQVTKDGALAGPRLLEHLVDCVVSFDGEDGRTHRVLRATKNRFGSTNEVGVLEMRHDGLVSVDDPTDVWLTAAGDRVGSCVFPVLEGSRALLVEIQALVGPTEIVPPRRVAVGVDRTRLAQVIAILSRHAGMRLGDQDVFVSVAGGARALEPAADLAIALAVASAHRGRPLGAGTVAFGELGLTGDLRPVAGADRRLHAASEKGLKCGIIPGGERVRRGAALDGAVGVGAIRAALEAAF
jgi:DNA repair protein RadA/Sms